jgi:hypothetical protein
MRLLRREELLAMTGDNNGAYRHCERSAAISNTAQVKYCMRLLRREELLAMTREQIASL